MRFEAGVTFEHSYTEEDGRQFVNVLSSISDTPERAERTSDVHWWALLMVNGVDPRKETLTLPRFATAAEHN